MKITPKIRKQINDKLYDICRDYRNQIPLGDIFTALRKAGMIAIQEDGCAWTGMLCGREGRANIEIAPVMSAKIAPDKTLTFQPVNNAVLSLSWHKMDTGRYETVAYVS